MIRQTLTAGALALAATALSTAPAFAQDGYSGYGVHAGELDIPVNKSQVVTSDRTIGKALVGNADIADVLPISNRSVYVLGKSMGTTSLTLYDNSNSVIAVMDITVGPDADGVRRQLTSLVPDEPIDVRLSNGSIILSGMVSDAGAASRAARIAAAYAGEENVINLVTVGGSQQVMLEVRFAEVNRTVTERLGSDAFFSNNDDFAGAIGSGAGITSGDGNTLAGGGSLELGSVADAFGVFNTVFNIGSLNIDAFLNALEREGLSKTLAEPTLVALSGEKASFLAGGEFPIPVLQGNGGGGGGSGGGGGNGITVEFKPFGVSLGFTPTVLGGKVINLIVEPEVSSIDASASVTINGLTVPGLQTRRASTTLELRDGESFAIAGLLQENFRTNVDQLPLLGSIPIIGSLFRSSQYQKGETELLIVVTPRLVQPIRPDQVRLPTDRVADPDAVQTLLNGSAYVPQELPPAAPAAVTTEGAGYEY
ncbi:type II and III secretion system protein family protein [Altererythrobacter sp. CAU 1778]